VKLSVGDLVIDNGVWNDNDGVYLYDRPPNLDGAVVTATLRPGTAALIIKLDRSDACCVYLLTCTGAGWTLGAYLCKVNT
jgi:hypothetical protein